METLKYTVIKDKIQYNTYCDILEELICKDDKTYGDEVELLTVLIEKWDLENNSFTDLDPIELVKNLMEEHQLKAKELAVILNLTKGTISKILNYKKGLSKDTIRTLSEFFKVSQEALNKPYSLQLDSDKAVKSFA